MEPAAPSAGGISEKLPGDVGAVLNDHNHGVLGNFAVGLPGHGRAGQAVHAEVGRGEDADEGVAQGLVALSIVHGGNLSEVVDLLQGVVNSVDAVVAVGGKLVVDNDKSFNSIFLSDLSS